MTQVKRTRQAVVVVHGMGEQRPLDMLNRFIDAAIPGTTETTPGSDNPVYYSRPIENSDAYESRVYLARKTDKYPQTEFYEYHWAHMMQGNKLDDLWATFRRILFQFPWNVPSGLRVVWGIFWAIIIFAAWKFLNSGTSYTDINVEKIISLLAGGGMLATALTWVITKILPGKITSSFIDVVRYLDTSPRSYAVRRNIRKGIVDLLKKLHETNRYQRIVVVAHSLGGYIAYDGITFLWTQMNQEHDAKKNGDLDWDVLSKLEANAEILLKNPSTDPKDYRLAQRELWLELGKQGNPWLITDLVTVGTPMYMADQLFTSTKEEFDSRVDRRQIATCPPQPDLPGNNKGKTLYSYPHNGGKTLYHGAPFSVVRWSNIWFPPHFGFFGDWFGGPLRRLFGGGILDIKLEGNDWKSWIPAWAHTLYFMYPGVETPGSVTTKLHESMELNSEDWLNPKASTKKSK